MIKFELIDNTETISVDLINNSPEIEMTLTDYNDKDIREDIEELRQTKVDKIEGKGLSTNDYTNEEKEKLSTLENYDDSEVRALIDTKQPRGDYALESEIPTKVSELENDEGYITTETDPTVPNHVKNITQNDIISWNNKADMSDIPDVSDFVTKEVNDLVNYTLKTNTGSLIDLEINQTTYVVTLSLKDQDGNTISTDTIDLPLENVVVSGSYDETNQKIVLTLQSGDTVDIPVGALVSGLQSEITSSNKLASDLVDDSNSGHKFTTASEKQTWNSKYTKPNGGIPKSDLASSVQSSLDKADTAIQDISGKQDTLIAGTNINIASDGKTISATDTTYSDATQSTSGLMSSTDKTKLDGIATGAEVNVQANWNEANTSSDAYIQNKPSIPKYYYGTCSTKNSTRAKVVECEGFVLEEGATISVLFTAAQTYNGAPTLNVNGTGAVTVQYKSGTSGIRYMWSAGEIIDFTYNGTYWVCHGRALATTTYYGVAKYSESIVSTSAALGLTPSAMNKAMLNIISGTPIYSSSATYEVGNKVRYSDNVWRCTTAISEAEAWDEEHWEVVSPLQNQIDLKQDTLVSGTNIKTINNTSLLGSGNIDIQSGGTDYSDLTNKPSINSVTLSGNKSLSDLGIQPSGSYATTTDLATKQDITDNNLTTTNKTIPSAINEVNSIAKGANQAVGYSNYSSMITAINAMDDEEFLMGQNIYVVTVNVPDLWVSSVESTSSTYTYVDDATVINDLATNGYIQVGYYKLSMLETQKVDLTNYQTKIDSSHKLSSDLVDDTSSTNKFVTASDITNWNGKYEKPSGGIPDTDLSSAVQTSLGKADTSIQSLDSCILKDSGSAVQMVSLTSGTGTTALGVKSMSSASSYISFSSTGGWLGSYGVSSTKKPVFYNGVGYTLATTDDVPKIVTLSQADYDDLVSGGTVDADTYYFIEE